MVMLLLHLMLQVLVADRRAVTQLQIRFAIFRTTNRLLLRFSIVVAGAAVRTRPAVVLLLLGTGRHRGGYRNGRCIR